MDDEALTRTRARLLLACVGYAETGDETGAREVLVSAKLMGDQLRRQRGLVERKHGEEGLSAPPTTPQATEGSEVAAEASGGNPGGSGLFDPLENPSRIVKRDDLTATQRCANCAEARKPLFCSAKCANEHVTNY